MKFAIVVLFVLLIFSFGLGRVKAQAITATTPTQLTGVGVHTSCQISSASQTNVCIAGDGMWISTNGAPYFQVTASAPVSAGVTSFNGQVGAVTYAAPVTSVNGKTGAVVLAATSTTTLQ